MILILSHADVEPTTEEVMDWLEALGASCFRLNGQDVDHEGGVHIEICGKETKIRFTVQSGELALDLVKAVWFRRWVKNHPHEKADLLSMPSEKLAYDIKKHLNLEAQRLSRYIFRRLSDVPWLSEPGTSSVDKLQALELAAEAGLATPATLVATERRSVQEFARNHGTLIVKSIGEAKAFFYNDLLHFMYTAIIQPVDIDAFPEHFSPSLFQQKVEKKFELRVFFLEEECYAMAIFSQLDQQTQSDFRRYNSERPNRNVPYRLSSATVAGIRRLMHSLGLKNGSLDLIRTPDGEDVFLEVNPVGQFGMVSHPCNYSLERKVAETLIRNAAYEHNARSYNT